MCLSVPAKIIKIEGENALVSTGGTEYEASLAMLENAEIGEYVLVHTGFALQKISEEDAVETYKLIQELEEFNRKDEEEKNE